MPDVSGNLLLRAVPGSWAGGVMIMPQAGFMRGMRLHAGISHQGNDFERAINGLYFGERTLLDARVSVPLGRFALDLWGTNLANDTYIRAAAGRQPQFYIGMPRPTDLILGEGRQVGLTLRLER